jgi:hypothetical protein
VERRPVEHPVAAQARPTMFAAIVIGLFVIGIIAFELARQWWRHNAWRRQWRDRGPDE